VTAAAQPAVRLRRQDKALWALIDRPGTRNAIDLDVIAGLEEMLAAARDAKAKVLVLRGAGGSFCSGADLNRLAQTIEDPAATRSVMSRLGGVLEQLEDAPWVTLAVVEGYAVAGGCELLLACDVVLASADARIGDRHVEYGLVPAAGASVRLPRAVGPAFARYLMLTGETVSGAEAAQRGLVSLAVPPERLDAELERVLSRLLSRGAGSLATIKRMLAEDRAERGRRLHRELDLFLEHLAASPDARVGLDAFCKGTTPTFLG
jgi:enoyl-CoA hydratase/carnithine racemase